MSEVGLHRSKRTDDGSVLEPFPLARAPWKAFLSAGGDATADEAQKGCAQLEATLDRPWDSTMSLLLLDDTPRAMGPSAILPENEALQR